MSVTIKVNGAEHRLEIDGDTPLLWAIRDNLGLTGTKFGCGIAACGACTVHADGEAIRSCSVSVADAAGWDIRTIETLSEESLNPIQQAWLDLDVPQCGYCQSGMIMAATALINESRSPSDADIDEAMSNICRCGTYNRVRAAIHAAVRSI
ncbi:(2Fe-2S)-binding protein [Pelagibius marinus]|uniref:(2Fe-2S)-binding protein n=1 Tax=Pelagibius marinus TaxID=2762760 RepID=UPI001872387C|nr:(2Fe-2S)-binding protein [Pelagibius marinus]